jgi:hypothetical protein
MATDVTVNITDRGVIQALNTPGGAIFKWRDKVASDTIQLATTNSPVNNPQDAQHRGGGVGLFKASWGFDRVGSNGHRVQATIYNGAPYADIVELGRAPTIGGSYEVFSWSKHKPPGSISAHHGTRGRNGKHILGKAVSAVMAAQGIAFSSV